MHQASAPALTGDQRLARRAGFLNLGSARSKRRLIAVVDDDPTVCRALARLLRSAGMDAMTSTSPTEFLDAEAWQDVDCLIVDVQMPSLMGTELRRRLLARGFRAPVIFITGQAGQPAGLIAREIERAAGFLQKPFSGDELLRLVRDSVAQHSS